jgi:hypothetical protein
MSSAPRSQTYTNTHKEREEGERGRMFDVRERETKFQKMKREKNLKNSLQKTLITLTRALFQKYIYTHTYIYTHRQTDREREKERTKNNNG